MSFFGGGDLSVTGTATSRHARPHSGKGRRTFIQEGSTKSNIFNIADTPRDINKQTVGTKSPSYHGDSSPTSSSLHITPDAPRLGEQKPTEQVGIRIEGEIFNNLWETQSTSKPDLFLIQYFHQ